MDLMGHGKAHLLHIKEMDAWALRFYSEKSKGPTTNPTISLTTNEQQKNTFQVIQFVTFLGWLYTSDLLRRQFESPGLQLVNQLLPKPHIKHFCIFPDFWRLSPKVMSKKTRRF